MSQQLFQEIKNIESEAGKILSESEKRSTEILKKAHADAIKLSTDKELELKSVRENTLSETLRNTEKSKINKLAKNKEELDKLRSAANKHKDKVVNLVLDELSKIIGE